MLFWTLQVAAVNSNILYKEQAKGQAVHPMAHLEHGEEGDPTTFAAGHFARREVDGV